jgi:hypothetical protein
MEQKNERLRDRLLSRLPQPANFSAYRDEVSSMLEKNEKRLSWEKRGASTLWIFVVGFFALLTSRGAHWLDTPKGHYCEFTVCLLLITGAVELLKHFINRTRVELLKEVKQVQLQVLELQASLRKGGEQ